jgi:SNF2 family DNA or RNA helicase
VTFGIPPTFTTSAPVFAYRMAAKDTVEEKVLELQEKTGVDIGLLLS